jgi:hypothetical protein
VANKQERKMTFRAIALGTALLAASVPALSTSAEAQRWGWRGGWGWGWGGLGLGFAAGALIGSALAAPYYGYGYYAPNYYYRYGYTQPYYGYAQPYYGYYGYAPAYGYGPAYYR